MSKTSLAESIVFYLDLSTDNLSKKQLFKGIEQFVKDKLDKIANSSFSCFYFLKENVPFLSEEMTDSKLVKNQINDDWKNRELSQSNFENGLFYCLSFLAQKAAKKAGNYRVIVITDTPSQKSSEYAEALMELVETVKNFPTFIDIIRIGKKERYSDDVKLRIISTLTSGGLFYAQNDKDFRGKFIALAKNKVLPNLREEGGQEIDPDKKIYYENVAQQLIPSKTGSGTCVICGKDLCEYCNQTNDKLECQICGKAYHECCGALYSWKKNIGLKNIFRCVSCGGLVKLDERTVYEINGETFPDDEVKITPEALEEKMEEEETWSPDEKEEEIPEETLETTSEGLEAPIAEDNGTKQNGKFKVRMGLFGPTPVGLNKDGDDNGAEEKKSASAPVPEEKVLSSEEKAAMARKKLAERRKTRKSNTGIQICRVCSKRLKPNEKICPNCGSPAF
ncbi:MAG: hypothetical protein ACTSRK_16845 [Promethearchaeota archaeon]